MKTESELKSIRLKRILMCYALKVIVMAVAALALFGAWGLMERLPSDASTPIRWMVAVIFSFSLLLFMGCVFFLCNGWFRNKIFSVTLLSLFFIWGSAGYFIWHVDRIGDDRDMEIVERQLESSNRAVAAFFPSRGGFEKVDKEYRLHYFIFHFSVIAFVAAVMFSYFGRALVNRFRKRWFVPSRYLNVFWDTTDRALLLARDIARSTIEQQTAFILPSELFFDEKELKTLTYRLDEFDAIWVMGELNNINKSDVRGHRHFFLGDSGLVNMSRASQLVDAMRRFRRFDPGNVSLFVRIGAEGSEHVFHEWAESVRDVVTPVIIRESDMIARRFIDRHPMLDCPGISINDKAEVCGSFRILLVGFGAIAQSVLREMIVSGQFAGTARFSVDVIDDNPGLMTAYESQYAEAVALYHVNLIRDVVVDGKGYEDFIKNHLKEYNRIVVSLADDVMNIRVAARLKEYVSDTGRELGQNILFARVSDTAISSFFRIKNDKVQGFGELDAVYSFDLIDFDNVEEMAKVVNCEWGMESGKDEEYRKRFWSRTGLFYQGSSRALAVGEYNMARLLGFKIVSVNDMGMAVTEDEFKKALENGREMTLAKNEHLRWSAYLRMQGYSCWDMKNPPIDQVEKKRANQLDTLRKHAGLVDFDDLPRVDYEIACAIRAENKKLLSKKDFEGDVTVDIAGNGNRVGSFQSFDIAIIRKIWETVNAAGMKLVKV